MSQRENDKHIKKYAVKGNAFYVVVKSVYHESNIIKKLQEFKQRCYKRMIHINLESLQSLSSFKGDYSLYMEVYSLMGKIIYYRYIEEPEFHIRKPMSCGI